MGVKQVMSLFTSGFTEEFIIESLDVGVFMRKTQSLLFVFGVDTLHALFKERSITVEEGLTTAVDTAAGAGHDFDSLEAVGILTDSSILAWRIPWTEEPSGLKSMGSQIVGHD